MKKLLAVIGAVTVVAGATVAGMYYLKKKGIITCEDEESLDDIDICSEECETDIPSSEEDAENKANVEESSET